MRFALFVVLMSTAFASAAEAGEGRRKRPKLEEVVITQISEEARVREGLLASIMELYELHRLQLEHIRALEAQVMHLRIEVQQLQSDKP